MPRLPISKACIAILLAIIIPSVGKTQIHYVNIQAIGAGDGTSWTNAYPNLQSAIDMALPGDSIFIAEGTYQPVLRHLGDSLRHSTFYIHKGISLFGGFSGVSGTEGGFTERDVKIYPTILSGDLGVIGSSADDAFHVVYLDHVPDSTLLDGLTISGGNGIGGAGYEAIGAGVFIDARSGASDPIFNKCTIKDNITSESGGGVAIQAENGGHSSPIFRDCQFTGNQGSGGGAISSYVDTEGVSNPTFEHCVFKGNAGPTAGGGACQLIAHSASSTIQMINCLLSGNYAPSSASVAGFVTGTGSVRMEIINTTLSGNSGSIRLTDIGQQLSSVFIRNSILFGNGVDQPSVNGAAVDAAHSVIPFGFPGENIIGLNPMFVEQPPVPDTAHQLGDLHLLPGSLALDSGLDAAVPSHILTDLDHHPRFRSSLHDQPGQIDMGAYELQGQTTATRELVAADAWRLFPNPASGEVVIYSKELPAGSLLRLMDTRGVTLYQQIFNTAGDQMTFDITTLSEGLYYIVISNQNQVAAKPLMIQRP